MYDNPLASKFLAYRVYGVSRFGTIFVLLIQLIKRVLNDMNIPKLDEMAIVSLELYIQLHTKDCALLYISN